MLAVIGDGYRKRGLSGGEKKRLSIATEIMDDPSVLLIDVSLYFCSYQVNLVSANKASLATANLSSIHSNLHAPKTKAG